MSIGFNSKKKKLLFSAFTVQEMNEMIFILTASVTINPNIIKLVFGYIFMFYLI